MDWLKERRSKKDRRRVTKGPGIYRFNRKPNGSWKEERRKSSGRRGKDK